MVGVLGGLAALAFEHLTDLVRVALVGGTKEEGLLQAARRLPWWKALLLPAAGATVATFLIRVVFRWATEASAPDVLESVSLRKGGMRLPAVLARSLGAAAVIGTGGSVGREGPIIQLGGAIASAFGRFFRRSPRDLAILIACGAAAGMAGAYNAPIGAAVFVMEVVLGSFVMESVAPVIVASVTSTLTKRALEGTESLYHVPPIHAAALWEA